MPELTSDNEVPGLEPGLGLLKLSGVVDDGGRVKGPSPLEKGVRWLKVSLGGGPWLNSPIRGGKVGIFIGKGCSIPGPEINHFRIRT